MLRRWLLQWSLTYIKKLGDYFVLINVENPNCNRAHVFETLIIAVIGGYYITELTRSKTMLENSLKIKPQP